MLQRVQQVALLLVAVGFGQTGLIFYALPLATLTTLVWSRRAFLGARADRDRAVRLLWLVVWSAFALALLAKMGLNARIVHYGFYLGLPATVLTVVLIAWLLPQLIERWNGAGAARTFRTIALIGFAAAIAPYLTISATRYRREGGANRRRAATAFSQAARRSSGKAWRFKRPWPSSLTRPAPRWRSCPRG